MKHAIRRVWSTFYAFLTNNIVVNTVAGVIRACKQLAEMWNNRTRRTIGKREQPLTVKDLWDRYLKSNPRLKWWYVLVVMMWFGWLPGIFIFPDYRPYNEAADARGNLVQMFELENTIPTERPNVRKELARSLLNLHEVGIGNKMNDGAQGEFKDTVIQQIQQTRKTGQAPRLDSSHRGLNTWVELGLSYASVWPLALVTLYGMRYVDRCNLQSERVADLPWKRGWPLLFAALSPLVLAPAMVISLIRHYRANKRAGVGQTDTTTEQTVEQVYEFKHDDKAARELYFELRSGSWQDYVRDRLEQIKQELKGLVNNILREQQQRNSLMGEQNRLEGVEATHDSATEEELAIEFDRILRHEAVHGVTTDGSDLLILVKARYTHEGVTYDLSDWELCIGRHGFRTRELRTGAKVDWHFWAHPIYRLPDGQFCFGATTAAISFKISQNKLAEAALLAADCLCQINDKDYEHLPIAFKVVVE